MSSFARVGCLLLIGASVGCQRMGVDEGSRTTYADSAGVRLVQNLVAAVQTVRIGIQEDLRIGSVDGPPETLLYLVRGMALGPDEEIYVGLSRPSEVRVFSRDGTYLRTIGRQGQGPGEYSDVNALFVSGESLVVLDLRAGRVTVTTLDGQLLRTAPIPREEGGSFSPLASFDDGWLVLLPNVFRIPAHGVLGERLTRIVSISNSRDPIGALEIAQGAADGRYPVLEVSGGRMIGMDMNGVLTGQTPLWEPSERWGTDRSGHTFVTANDEYRVDVFDAGGTLVRRIRRTHEVVPITSETKSRLLEAVVTHYDSAAAQTEFGTDPADTYRFLLSVPTSTSLPALGRLEVAGDGAFIVERPDMVDDPVALQWTRLGPQPTHWDVFTPDGAYAGTVTLPANFTPHLFLGVSVLGVMRDDLGVEYVVRYQLENPPAS